MGLNLSFYAGDAQQILKAVRASDFDTLEKHCPGDTYADFSLHITPRDLELLTIVACQFTDKSPLSFRQSLDLSGEFVDEVDRGGYLVVKPWVEIWSSLKSTYSHQLVEKWFAIMQHEYNDDPEILPTPEAVEAINHLISMSQKAITNKLSVVHVWFA